MLSSPGTPVVMVVDDDPLIRATLTAALASHGVEAVSAPDLPAALGAGDADAVLLDAGLPGCSLSESLDRLGRRDDGTRRPILVMSGSAAPPGELTGTGVAYLAKPFPLAEFLHAVDALVSSAPEDGIRVEGGRST